jgi:hypothetical protein
VSSRCCAARAAPDIHLLAQAIVEAERTCLAFYHRAEYDTGTARFLENRNSGGLHETLAEQILLALEEVFPSKLTGRGLKTSTSSFANISEQEFFLALDAIYKTGLVTGNPVRSGFTQELRDVLDLEITSRGRESLHKETLKDWTSYYWAFFDQFGVEFYQRWKGKIISGAVGGVGGFLASHENAWLPQKSALMGTLLGVAIYTICDLFRVPWLVHKKTLKQEAPSGLRGFAILGFSVIIALFVGMVYLTSPLWTKKNEYRISDQDPSYFNTTNTLHAFKFLASHSPNCSIRVTAPPENMEVARIIVNLAGNFCKTDLLYDPSGPQEEIIKGSVDNAIMIHMAKEPSTRDGFVSEMGNVFSVRRTFDVPSGSPPESVGSNEGAT